MPRRASQHRLIEWTGERCVPWADDVQVVYEHFHRYLWARDLVRGKAVLDLGCGEGYGASILAESAASVRGVDCDEPTIQHARLSYVLDTLSFEVGDALELSGEADDAYDVVVAFEVIEHVADHDRFFATVRRVLRPGGVLLLSTPNRLAYEAAGGENPFHVHELSDAELDEALSANFAHHATFVQRVAEGSRIELRGATGVEATPLRIAPDGEDWTEVGAPEANYLVAVASDEPLPELANSTLLDHTLHMLELAERRADAQATDAAAKAAKAALAQDELAAECERLRAAALEAQAAQARSAEAEAQLYAELQEVGGELLQARNAERAAHDAAASASHALALTNESITWRGLQKVKQKVRGSGPKPRLAARAAGAALRTAGRVQARRKAAAAARPVTTAPAPPPITLTVPSSPNPVISIVIPVHADPEMTHTCLTSVAAASLDAPAYEVIVADDAAPQDVQDMLAGVRGIRVLRNPENLGFLRSVNRAVAEARGSVVVLLNNDTEPQIGWLNALVDRLDSDPTIGAVGGRLIYPDGSLQEAGGVLFADGSAINYGNGQNPGAAAFRFARPVDYCSAALLAIRKDVWDELGGFDELFVPGYYEDTDLCFRIRQAGYEVWFEPRSFIIHKEGGSHGTDVTQGVKRYQVVNQQHFIDRWGAELAHRPPTATPAGAWEWANRSDGPVVFIADHMVPEPDRDSGSLRMSRILEVFVELGARVIFYPANGAAPEGYTAALEAHGIEVLDGGTNLFARLFELRECCQLAVLSRPQVASQLLADLRTSLPNATIVYDTVDLHWIREEARGEFEPVPAAAVLALREIELALARAADLTAVVTSEERATLHDQEPTLDVRYLPNVHDLPAEAPGREGRDGLLFVGGFRHLPNVDAARLLGEAIMPAVRARGLETTLTIIGPDAPDEVNALAGDDVDIAGWVPEVEPYLDGALALIAPLRYGAGMKGKIGQALAHGLPVITTSVGAQGFGLVDGQDALLAETPEEFAAAVERLAADDALWQRLAANGRDVIGRTCGVEVMTAAVRDLLELTAREAPSLR